MANFLLEIGSEEIPSRFLASEELELENLFKNALHEQGLGFDSLKAMSTPRRLTLKIENLSPFQDTKEEIIMGPPARLAFEENGSPSKALLGFAKNNDIPVQEVFRTNTEKGEYMACRISRGGKAAGLILSEICPMLIEKIPFAKSMRWGDGDLTYGRPLRWVVALLDNEIVPFKIGDLVSDRHTYGHRVHGLGPFTISHADQYEDVVANKCAVIIDPEKRKKIIKNKGDELASEKGGSVIWKEDLLQEVQGLVEHPVPLLGKFDPSYLEIPAETLLTSMQSHQKSFGLLDSEGKLLPYFLTVLNTTPLDIENVRHGWERVLKARLEDARFFWEADLKESADQRLEKLEKVIFIGALGSMADKGRRLEKLCGWIAEQLNPPADVALAQRAGKLAKTDLVSGMVGEFDTLQGIMGGIYAEKSGENQAVAAAIKEQYLPAGPDTPVPQTILGAILSMADKTDTLTGCFGLNMIPTGMADPNGLRRCALGIIRIMLAWQITITPQKMFNKALEIYGDTNWKIPPAETLDKLDAFFMGRLRNYFINSGYNSVLVDAVLGAGMENVPDCKARLDAITAFAKQENYEKSAQTMKRVENISKKEEAEDSVAWDDSLLQDEAEKNLAQNLKEILPRLDAKLAEKDYAAALKELENLGSPVDGFFDNVLVMSDDSELRRNRLNMLRAIAARFAKIARFSALQI